MITNKKDIIVYCSYSYGLHINMNDYLVNQQFGNIYMMFYPKKSEEIIGIRIIGREREKERVVYRSIFSTVRRSNLRRCYTMRKKKGGGKSKRGVIREGQR